MNVICKFERTGALYSRNGAPVVVKKQGTARGNEDDEESRRMQHEVGLVVKSFRRIISTYLNYAEAAEQDVRRYERSFQRLSPSHKALLSHLPLKYQKLRWCISENSYFIFEMLKAFEPPLDLTQDIHIDENERPGNSSDYQSFSRGKSDGSCGHASTDATVSNAETKVTSSAPKWLDPSLMLRVPLADVDMVRSVIRNIVRDWSTEGQIERDQCYKPILEELNGLFPDRCKESPPACLVPGSGLGRLAFEISRLGFICRGNEFSDYMMICSSFILNHTRTANEWTIYPWIHSNCNSLSDSDQLRPVSFPDIHPASAGTIEGFSVCDGDFVEVCSDPSQEGAWDAVVTCFFLGTAHNIVEYIEIISRILKEGGVWINLGPLHYHFADMYGPRDENVLLTVTDVHGHEDEMSIELSLEDVKNVALHYGFEFEKCSTLETNYANNPRSMMQKRYRAEFWTARKKKTGMMKEGSMA